MSLIPRVNLTCSFGFDFRDNRLFGYDCFGLVEPVYDIMLDGSNAIEKVESLPSCDEVCENSGSSQPNYEQFLSLNRTKLHSLCKKSRDSIILLSRKQCRFNQGSP